jgi:hypothetical protein
VAATPIENNEPQRLDEPGPRPVPSVSARRLLVATDELDTSRAPPDRAHIVSVLYALADALDVIVPYPANEILRVREVTNELGRSDGRADAEAGLVRIALDSAVRALAHVQPLPDTDRTRLARAIDALQDATERVDPDHPLAVQYRALRSAFRASVHAVYAATGAPDPEVATTPTAHR